MLRLSATSSFAKTLTRTTNRISTIISSKLDDFFELAEYEWTPKSREDTPSMYLYELVNWLTTVVDSLVVKEVYKNEAYKGAVTHVAECLMVNAVNRVFLNLALTCAAQEFLTGRNVPAINDNAISNLLVDVDFLEEELKRIGRSHLCAMFGELRSVNMSFVLYNATELTFIQICSIPLSETVQNYLVPSTRQASYSTVKPKKLAALLEKTARAGLSSRDAIQREQGAKRQKEAEAVGRLFPGENR